MAGTGVGLGRIFEEDMVGGLEARGAGLGVRSGGGERRKRQGEVGWVEVWVGREGRWTGEGAQ